MAMPRYSMDPFQQIKRDLDQVFQQVLGEGFMPMSQRRLDVGAITPEVDVSMDKGALRIEVDLPGIDPQNVTCTVQDRVLTIKGERNETLREGAGRDLIRERRFGHFERQLTLPEEIDEDSLQASFGKGVLTITANMKSGMGQERRIEIGRKTGQQQKAPAQVQQQQPQQPQSAQPQATPGQQAGSPQGMPGQQPKR